MVKNELLSQLENNSLPSYESCLEGTMIKRSFTGYGLRSKVLVHLDSRGLMNVKALGGNEYFISFIDNYSWFVQVYLIHHKSNSLQKFKEYKTEVENQLGKTIKTI